MTATRVGLIGHGAIGSVIASRLAEGAIAGVELVGVLRRNPSRGDVDSLDELLDRRCDVVIEAAGHDAAAEFGPHVLGRGHDLVLLSAGVLADREVEQRFAAAGPGRLAVSTGALGGLDIARALRESGSLESISISSTTTPSAVPASVVRDGEPGPYRVFGGTAREAALAFPRLTNVAATAALATLGLDAAGAELWVDPAAAEKRHVVNISAGASRVRVEITNDLSASNPRTSAVTPYSVIRLLRDRVEPVLVGV